MKIFWLIVVVLAIGAGATLLLRSGEGDAGPAMSTDVAERAAKERLPDEPAIEKPVESASPMGAVEEPEPREPPAPSEESTPEVAIDAPAPMHEDLDEAVEKLIADLERNSESTDALPLEAPSTPGGRAASGATNDDTSATIAESAPAPDADVREVESGVLVGDDLLIKGKGTRDEPYLVSWGLLMSAKQTYRPKQGLEELPEWVDTLEDSFVRVSGYLSFPLVSGQVDQVLLMRNQWDGCCIGVPPTPYDAIEVELSTPTKPRRGLFNFGTITGRFKVDPYVRRGWLLGLYLMEDGQVEVGM